MDTEAFLSIPPPLRPSPADLECFARLATGQRAPDRPVRMLVLGCTPDFWSLALPPGSTRLAADRSQAMLQGLWPGGPENGLHADWSDLPLPDASQDLVLCDGGFTLLGFPAAHREVISEIARVLEPGGRLLLRLHPQPEPQEQPGAVTAALLSGDIGNSSALKLRLAAALCEDPNRGIPLDRVWQCFEAAIRDVADLPTACGWPARDITRMRAYAGCADRYTFPTLERQLAVLAPPGGPFRVRAVERPATSAGFESPIVALERV